MTDKRHVPHDLADLFCTSVEGVRGQKAKDWRLVDTIAKPLEFSAKVRTRALELAEQSDRPADGKGMALTPLAVKVEANALCHTHVSVKIDRTKRTATWTINAPRGMQPTDITGIEALDAAWFPLAIVRELEDAILIMRAHDLEIGLWLIKTQGEAVAVAVLATDATLSAHRDHWLVRKTIGLLRCTLTWLKVSSRSLFALIEPGSCFVGTYFELALACDRSDTTKTAGCPVARCPDWPGVKHAFQWGGKHSHPHFWPPDGLAKTEFFKGPMQ